MYGWAGLCEIAVEVAGKAREAIDLAYGIREVIGPHAEGNLQILQEAQFILGVQTQVVERKRGTDSSIGGELLRISEREIACLEVGNAPRRAPIR